MNYEQKYKEALETVQEILSSGADAIRTKTLKLRLQSVFPELAESKDERIKKCIIDTLKNYHHLISTGGVTKEDMIAWLEKQGENSVEPKWCHHKVDLSNCSEEYRKAYYDGWNNCNMQHSQCKTESNDEDEKIRKALKQGFFEYGNSFTKFGGIKVGDIIAWLEKLGKQKSVWSEEIPNCHKTQGKSALEAIKEEKVDNQNCVKSADKVEPKFKVGDWIVSGKSIAQISDIQGQYYIGIDIYGNDLTSRSDKIHLWTRADAKDGDILVMTKDCSPFIFKKFTDPLRQGHPMAYGGLDEQDNVIIPGSANRCWDWGEIQPATKEQRDLLFQKMKEAGYEWDNEKKELRKIESKMLEMRGNQVISEIIKNQKEMPGEFTKLVHENFWDLIKDEHKMLDADKVIDWLKTKVYDDSTYGKALIDDFKKAMKGE